MLALEPVPPLGPAGVVLALGARMAGVFPQTPAQRRELGAFARYCAKRIERDQRPLAQ